MPSGRLFWLLPRRLPGGRPVLTFAKRSGISGIAGRFGELFWTHRQHQWFSVVFQKPFDLMAVGPASRTILRFWLQKGPRLLSWRC